MTCDAGSLGLTLKGIAAPPGMMPNVTFEAAAMLGSILGMYGWFVTPQPPAM
eukprot:CAMPEP_0185269736 /NCGR_PEP_ID=MMETSP1359-20130426/40675_1 /TAXON_ID=552665 /ORGANISM="Bigelowiella longifila, Strain CCMP242" /LENGTH=51 /DNA_ID=CAMNT_0027861047 /DNA_START=260 /DNA_END=412 /DNA_ORIENTATION=+